MILLEDALPAQPNIKKRIPHSEDVFIRARDFYHDHEDMRGERIYVEDENGEVWYALRFRHNRLDNKGAKMLLPTYVSPYWAYSTQSPRMDYTYLDAYDGYVFAQIEEYSCFMARLIRTRYPHKVVCFLDARARWFVPDVEVFESRNAALAAHPEVDSSRFLEVESHMGAGRMIKDTGFAVSAALMASVFWASEPTSYGERNPDKLFYLIKPEIGESGLAKFLSFTLGFYDIALHKAKDVNCEILPVVDTGIPGDDNQFNGGNGADVWKMFFEPLGSHSLEEVYDSKNVIVSQEGNVTVNPYLLALKRNPNVSALIGRYVRLNARTRAYCESMRSHVIPATAGRVLGVVGRGTDFNHPVIVRYRQRPLTPQELLDKVGDIVVKHGFDYVFLATEDQRVYDLFMESDLSHKILSVPQQRYDLSRGDDQHKLLVDVYKEAADSQGRDGYAETLRYLSILYILSQTDALVSSTECGATIFAEGFKREAFEFVDIYGR